MGCVSSKCNKEKKQLRARIHFLEEEIRVMRSKGEQEKKAYEQCRSMLASKEMEWKKERKRFKDEYGALRKKLEEEERRRRAMEAAAKEGGGEKDNGWYLVEQMRAEQARREEAVEKWKQLYLAIKTELDDLISRTGQGDGFCWGTDEDVVFVLQRELKVREDMLEVLRRRLMTMEREGIKRDREIDILRQSLRILSGTKRVVAKLNPATELRSGA